MSGLQIRRGAGAGHTDPLDRNRPDQPRVEYQNATAEATITKFPRRQQSLRQRASIRLAELYRLAQFRREHRLTVDTNLFAFVLAATLACGGAGNLLIRGRVNRVAGMEARPRVIPWAGLDAQSLRKGVSRADLGEIGDDELDTIIEAVRRWQEANGVVLISAARLGEMLALTSVERAECRIRTIDALDEPKAERKARRSAEKRTRDMEFNRTRRGRVPRPVYIEQAEIRRRLCLEHGICDRTLRRWIKDGKVNVRSPTFNDIDSLPRTSDFGYRKKMADAQPAAGPARHGGARRSGCAGGPAPGAQAATVTPRRSRRARASGAQVVNDGDQDGGGRDAGAVLALISAARALVSPAAPVAASLGLSRALLEATAEADPAELGEAVAIVSANLARLLRPHAANDNRLALIVQRLAA